MSLSVLLSALALAASALVSQSDLSGYWVLRVPRANGDGTFQETFFELKQSGEEVTGRQLVGQRELPITEGVFKDGTLHFVLTPPGRGAGAAPLRLVYEGKLAPDGSFSLTSTGRGPAPITGRFERSSKQAALPAPLPLPALHNVPDNGLVRTPPMGWNSWNKFAGRVADADVRGMADAMVASGMPGRAMYTSTSTTLGRASRAMQTAI